MTQDESIPRSRLKWVFSYGGIRREVDLAGLRARTRAEIVALWLPVIVHEVLSSHEIRTGIAQAGLDDADLRRHILQAREDVLAPADTQLERLVNAVVLARTGVSRGSAGPMWARGTWSTLVASVLIASVVSLVVLVRARLPWWGTGLGFLLALVLGVGNIASGVRLPRHSRRGGLSQAAAAMLSRWWGVCRDEGVLPFVRHVLDRHLTPRLSRFVLSITAEDAPGLRGTSEMTYVVRTGSVHGFLAVAEQLPTGAIGLAGPRGVGKTSIIDYFAGRLANDNGPRAVKVTVSAPVQYDPKDFVLHLFAAVCREVLRARDLTTGVTGGPLSAPGEWMRAVVWRRRVRTGIVGVARRHLENIHYLQTRTSGWSGKVPLPLKLEAGWSRSTQRERRPQTYPELVSALSEFLRVFTAQESTMPAMIIAIDELDKIESADRAKQFLNEIKAVFGVPGIQFLVSVSEDALTSFEQRELQVRDAFDSAFQEIVRVDYLTLADTAELISSRVLRLPEPFKWLVHCMSGGLPRDVVRTTREMVAFADDPPPNLDHICHALVAKDLARKSHAFQLDCRYLGDSPEVTMFIQVLSQLSANATTLRGLVPVLRHVDELAPLSVRAAVYAYHSATLLEVFQQDHVDKQDKDTFNLLARAKQSLAVHPRLAWSQIDEFRRAWGLAIEAVD